MCECLNVRCMNNYLLLRDNKESGPFSLDDLIHKGLKAYDLVWIEGKSAAWRYPSEITELKPYAPAIEEQPQNRFLKKGPVAATANICNADTYNKTTAIPKPRIRIKAEWSRIQAPVAAATTTPATAPATTPVAEKSSTPQPAVQSIATPVKQPAPVTEKPSWEDSWLNWQQEQAAVKQAAKKAPAYTAHNIPAATRVDEQPVLETKFSQSLSEIKEKYAATILKAKGKAGELNKFKSGIIAALLAIPLLGFGMWLGHKFTAKEEPGKVVYAKTPVDNKKPLQPDVSGEEPMNNIPAPDPKMNGKEMVPGFDDNNGSAEKPVAKQKAKPAGIKHSTVAKITTPAGKTQAAVAQQQVAAHKQQPVVYGKLPASQSQAATTPDRKYAVTQPAAGNPGERSKTINPAIVKQSIPLPGGGSLPLPPPPPFVKAAKNADNRPVFNHLPASTSVDDYVTVEADRPYTQSVQDAKLNVQNVADIPLDLVVIDVQYFDAANRFKNGQTIRIRDIPAGESINVKVPDNANATKLRYKVSLVSADKKNIYIVGEDE